MLVGQNAQGKTNLLEAIYLLAKGRLLRGVKDQEAIMDGADGAEVIGSLLDSGTQLSVRIDQSDKKRAYLNGAALPRTTDLIGRLVAISFSSADLPIVRGEPADRRLFLDLELSALYPAYKKHLATYKRALEQRNSLLRRSFSHPVTRAEYEVWEQRLAEHGAPIRQYRHRYAEELLPELANANQLLGGHEAVGCEYVPRDPADAPETIAAALHETRSEEERRGTTTVGPHRDELLLSVDGRELRLYGSQGQQRTMLIGLKLASARLARERLSVRPMLLLDDIFSDLDGSRRAKLMATAIEEAGQIILTCTELSQLSIEPPAGTKTFQIASGCAVRQ